MQHSKKISKTLLRNIIRQTETHNRIVEEEECWRQHATKSVSSPTQKIISKARQSESLSTDQIPSKSMKCRAHMDNADEVRPEVYADRHCEKGHQNNFWLRQLDSVESSDPNRWGHSGYKELYPQDFETPCSASGLNSDSDCHSSSKCDQNSADPAKKLKHKKKRCSTKDRHGKKKKSKKRIGSPSVSSAPGVQHRTESKKRKRKDDSESKKKKKKKKRKHHDN